MASMQVKGAAVAAATMAGGAFAFAPAAHANATKCFADTSTAPCWTVQGSGRTVEVVSILVNNCFPLKCGSKMKFRVRTLIDGKTYRTDYERTVTNANPLPYIYCLRGSGPCRAWSQDVTLRIDWYDPRSGAWQNGFLPDIKIKG